MGFTFKKDLSAFAIFFASTLAITLSGCNSGYHEKQFVQVNSTVEVDAVPALMAQGYSYQLGWHASNALVAVETVKVQIESSGGALVDVGTFPASTTSTSWSPAQAYLNARVKVVAIDARAKEATGYSNKFSTSTYGTPVVELKTADSYSNFSGGSCTGAVASHHDYINNVADTFFTGVAAKCVAFTGTVQTNPAGQVWPVVVSIFKSDGNAQISGGTLHCNNPDLACSDSVNGVKITLGAVANGKREWKISVIDQPVLDVNYSFVVQQQNVVPGQTTLEGHVSPVWVKSSNKPVIDSFTFSHLLGANPEVWVSPDQVYNPFVQKVEIVTHLTHIGVSPLKPTHACVKVARTAGAYATPPAANDACWKNFTCDGIAAANGSKCTGTGAADTYKIEYGKPGDVFFGANKGNLYLHSWVKGENGQVSLKYPTGPINYDPGTPPQVYQFLADHSGNNVSIKWSVTDDKELPTQAAHSYNAVELQYTVINPDGSTDWKPFAENVARNAQVGGCSLGNEIPAGYPNAANRVRGCYKWTMSAGQISEINGKPFKVRLKVTDQPTKSATLASSSSFNSKVSYIAGQTESGVSGHSKSAMLLSLQPKELVSVTSVSPGSFVVRQTNGDIFFRSRVGGIWRIDGISGNVSVFIPKAASTSDIYDGNDAEHEVAGEPKATIYNPYAMILAEDDSLWIQDDIGSMGSLYRRYDFETGKLETRVGAAVISNLKKISFNGSAKKFPDLKAGQTASLLNVVIASSVTPPYTWLTSNNFMLPKGKIVRFVYEKVMGGQAQGEYHYQYHAIVIDTVANTVKSTPIQGGLVQGAANNNGIAAATNIKNVQDCGLSYRYALVPNGNDANAMLVGTSRNANAVQPAPAFSTCKGPIASGRVRVQVSNILTAPTFSDSPIVYAGDNKVEDTVLGNDGKLYAFRRAGGNRALNVAPLSQAPISQLALPATYTAKLSGGANSSVDCADATNPNNCWDDVGDMFVSDQGQIYYMARGKIKSFNPDDAEDKTIGWIAGAGFGNVNSDPQATYFAAITHAAKDFVHDTYFTADTLINRLYKIKTAEKAIQPVAGDGTRGAFSLNSPLSSSYPGGQLLVGSVGANSKVYVGGLIYDVNNDSWENHFSVMQNGNSNIFAKGEARKWYQNCPKEARMLGIDPSSSTLLFMPTNMQVLKSYYIKDINGDIVQTNNCPSTDFFTYPQYVYNHYEREASVDGLLAGDLTNTPGRPKHLPVTIAQANFTEVKTTNGVIPAAAPASYANTLFTFEAGTGYNEVLNKYFSPVAGENNFSVVNTLSIPGVDAVGNETGLPADFDTMAVGAMGPHAPAFSGAADLTSPSAQLVFENGHYYWYVIDKGYSVGTYNRRLLRIPTEAPNRADFTVNAFKTNDANGIIPATKVNKNTLLRSGLAATVANNNVTVNSFTLPTASGNELISSFYYDDGKDSFYFCGVAGAAGSGKLYEIANWSSYVANPSQDTNHLGWIAGAANLSNAVRVEKTMPGNLKCTGHTMVCDDKDPGNGSCNALAFPGIENDLAVIVRYNTN